MDTTHQLKNNIKSLIKIPKLSEIQLEILTQPHVAQKEFIKAVAKNPEITKQILKWANSSLYQFSEKIDSLEKTVQIFGFENVKNMILAVSAFQIFKDIKIRFNKDEYWKHAIATAVASEIIKTPHNKKRELPQFGIMTTAFWAGLFHDIGKIILATYIPSIYIKILMTTQEKNLLLDETEKIILGITHAQVGKWLAQEWHLPNELSNVIEFHHDPELSPSNSDIVYIVHAADIFVRSINIGFPGDNSIPKIRENSLKISSFSESKLLEILKKIDQTSQNAFSILL